MRCPGTCLLPRGWGSLTEGWWGKPRQALPKCPAPAPPAWPPPVGLPAGSSLFLAPLSPHLTQNSTAPSAEVPGPRDTAQTAFCKLPHRQYFLEFKLISLRPLISKKRAKGLTMMLFSMLRCPLICPGQTPGQMTVEHPIPIHDSKSSSTEVLLPATCLPVGSKPHCLVGWSPGWGKLSHVFSQP
jgi:hypothetical protein